MIISEAILRVFAEKEDASVRELSEVLPECSRLQLTTAVQNAVRRGKLEVVDGGKGKPNTRYRIKRRPLCVTSVFDRSGVEVSRVSGARHSPLGSWD